MPLGDALHQREPRPVALEFLRPVQPLEQAEQLAGVGHAEADAVVLDRDPVLLLGADRPDPDLEVRPRPVALDPVSRVGQNEIWNPTWKRRPKRRVPSISTGPDTLEPAATSNPDPAIGS